MKISEILDFLREESISFAFAGNETDTVEGFSSLGHYKPGSFTWINDQKTFQRALTSLRPPLSLFLRKWTPDLLQT